MDNERHELFLRRIKIEGLPAWKWLLITVSLIAAGYILLFPAAYGLVGGIYLAGPVAIKNTKLFDEMFTPDQRAALRRGELKKEDLQALSQGALMAAVKTQAAEVKWVLVFPAMNLVVFGLLGFIAGKFGIVRYVGVIPIAMLWMTISVMNSEIFELVQGHKFTVSLSVSTQFASVYIFAMLGKPKKDRS
jgi:hypothetical protein